MAEATPKHKETPVTPVDTDKAAKMGEGPAEAGGGAPPTVDEGERWIEWMPVHSLVPQPRNPKTHDIATLKKSYERWGAVEAPAVDERSGRLVAGHGRCETLRDLEAAGSDAPTGVRVGDDGRWQIAVQRGWASTNDTEAEGYVVTSNRTVELGGWDDPLLDAVLADVADAPLGLTGVGFEPPVEDIPNTSVENLTPLRWAHALVSYPVDEHDAVGKALADLEANPKVRIRATVNDAKA